MPELESHTGFPSFPVAFANSQDVSVEGLHQASPGVPDAFLNSCGDNMKTLVPRIMYLSGLFQVFCHKVHNFLLRTQVISSLFCPHSLLVISGNFAHIEVSGSACFHCEVFPPFNTIPRCYRPTKYKPTPSSQLQSGRTRHKKEARKRYIPYRSVSNHAS